LSDMSAAGDRSDRIGRFILDLLRDQMNRPVDPGAAAEDVSLGPSGLAIESLALLELAAHLEEEFGVTFADHELARVRRLTVEEIAREAAERADS
jgi:acyl carrier protein